MKTYTVVFEKSATGWCAFYPDVLGLASCGQTLEEVRELTLEGLEFHLKAMLNDGLPLPQAKHSPDFLDVELDDLVIAPGLLEVQAA